MSVLWSGRDSFAKQGCLTHPECEQARQFLPRAIRGHGIFGRLLHARKRHVVVCPPRGSYRQSVLIDTLGNGNDQLHCTTSAPEVKFGSDSKMATTWPNQKQGQALLASCGRSCRQVPAYCLRRDRQLGPTREYGFLQNRGTWLSNSPYPSTQGLARLGPRSTERNRVGTRLLVEDAQAFEAAGLPDLRHPGLVRDSRLPALGLPPILDKETARQRS